MAPPSTTAKPTLAELEATRIMKVDSSLKWNELKYAAEYPRNQAIIDPADVKDTDEDDKEIARPEVNRTSLMAIHYVTDQLTDTLNQYQNHFRCDEDVAETLKSRFLSSVHWQKQEFLEKPLQRLEIELASRMDEPFAGEPVLQSSGDEHTTYGEIFHEIKVMIKDLSDELNWYIRREEKVDLEATLIPTATPREILLELALWNTQGRPEKQLIRKLQNPQEELQLTYTPIDIRLDAPDNTKIRFKNLDHKLPGPGVPAMYHVAVGPSEDQWLIGSTTPQFKGLEGSAAYHLCRSIRETRMNENYKVFLRNAYKGLKTEEEYQQRQKKQGKRAVARKKVVEIYEQSDFFKQLKRSDHVGISLTHNLEVKPNCWRCKTMFAFEENLIGVNQTMLNSERHRFGFDTRSPYCCAEMISNLQAMIHLRPRDPPTDL